MSNDDEHNAHGQPLPFGSGDDDFKAVGSDYWAAVSAIESAAA
jgi:hypothetical protein